MASKPEVNHVQLDTIEGLRKKPRRHELRWFCVWGVVAIQIEAQVKGLIDLEDRLVLVRATDPDDAQRRLQREWSKYAEPYLNPNGYLVRWQLIAVRDVYELFEDTLDPGGTEVYSRLRKVRLRPEYRWRPDRRLKPTRLKNARRHARSALRRTSDAPGDHSGTRRIAGVDLLAPFETVRERSEVRTAGVSRQGPRRRRRTCWTAGAVDLPA